MDSSQNGLKDNTRFNLVRIVLVFFFKVDLNLRFCLITHSAYVCAIPVQNSMVRHVVKEKVSPFVNGRIYSFHTVVEGTFLIDILRFF